MYINNNDNIQFMKDLLNYQACTNDMCYFIAREKMAFEDIHTDIRKGQNWQHAIWYMEGHRYAAFSDKDLKWPHLRSMNWRGLGDIQIVFV